jgi:hypothetical protein
VLTLFPSPYAFAKSLFGMFFPLLQLVRSRAAVTSDRKTRFEPRTLRTAFASWVPTVHSQTAASKHGPGSSPLRWREGSAAGARVGTAGVGPGVAASPVLSSIQPPTSALPGALEGIVGSAPRLTDNPLVAAAIVDASSLPGGPFDTPGYDPALYSESSAAPLTVV